MDKHSHSFNPGEWPFDEAVNHAAFTTRRVVHDGYPILLVTHDENGDWQFLCGTTNEVDDAVVACLGCLFERHPFIRQFAAMPRGWLAWRDAENSEWHMEQQGQE